LHPEGPEKIIRNFGIEVEEFKMDVWLEQSEKLKEDKTTEGIFAPWCIYKEDFLAVGGHDELFAPQSKEDSDLFNRFQLNGYKFIQPWDALVYHFTSRGSRFNTYAGGSAGNNSKEWLHTTTKNGRNFIRKWGHFVMHDRLMKPIIPPKYNIEIKLVNATFELLQVLEPWADNIYVDLTEDLIDKYIKQEQPNTILPLSSRINQTVDSEIVIRIDGKNFTNQDYNHLQQIAVIIESSGEIGEFQLENLFINIKQMNQYQNNLTVV
jgi:hypothetical protein